LSTEITQGSVVYSVKGRDKGNCYVCVAVENESFVLISDGKLHKLGKPKKKNIKHLKPTGHTLDVIARKLKENSKIFDSELNSSLRNFCNNTER
jgi:ribosomal protein L14E/L6E/L27E